ncbi:right-handed parallel beta-helix repeat-containing protein [Rhizobium sp. CSW-27]|uniref:right-handed parallel beta-helix repeat-containing protein n=1 Tax=Rhizobium sp. CSW-27 TaxID=2839985 RepID=UPI001C035EDF|nr:right-handed parallel beta-helix repeat-containing protein [Rhizobium sp. CSW-27]MBT9371138.1 right-handed parallel beta-helix repeat-containing protein [Rhizobium sp. CSW-27]
MMYCVRLALSHGLRAGYVMAALFVVAAVAHTPAAASEPQLGIPQVIENGWMVRLNHPDNAKTFDFDMTGSGFKVVTAANSATLPAHISVHRKLDTSVSALRFILDAEGDLSENTIILYDAAANELWRHQGALTKTAIELTGLHLNGEIVFRILRGKGAPGAAYTISGIETAADVTPPVIAPDGFTLVDTLDALRGYARLDNVRVRLKPGTYRLDKALYQHFVEFSGNDSQFDMTGVRIQANTELFSPFGVIPGVGGFYSVIDLTGDRVGIEGGYFETYGDKPGLQPRNKILNITGDDVTLNGTTIQTSGSVPWGYGSLFGISGDPVRKMNGIRVGAPADRVILRNCTVHMRAMGHGIFIQGAADTLIDGCKIDGLLRSTNDILAETTGFAAERDFKIKGSGEGVLPDANGRIPRGDMVSLSEDGIRLYDKSGTTRTGKTTIRNATVVGMRRGICTGFGVGGNLIVNSTVRDTIQAGFHVGSGDIVIGGKADAKYSEALSIAQNSYQGARVELEILDSRGGNGNDLLAQINGSQHRVTLHSSQAKFVPAAMVVEFATNRGFLGKLDNYGADRPDGLASDIELLNLTPAKVNLSQRAERITVVAPMNSQ